MKMAAWTKDEITLKGGTKVMAQMPLIVSASRSTDMLAFYSDWFIDFIPARISVITAMRTPTMLLNLKIGSSIVCARMRR